MLPLIPIAAVTLGAVGIRYLRKQIKKQHNKTELTYWIAEHHVSTANGINPNAVSPKGDPLLTIAIEENNPDIVIELLKLGADPNVRNSKSIHSLHLALQSPNAAFFIHCLITTHADINAMDQNGNTLLHLTHDKTILTILVASGACLDAQNSEGKTPVFTKLDSYAFTQTLVNAGASIDIQDSTGKTPLFYAINTPSAKFLLLNGANPNVQDHDGKTPLFYAKDEQTLYLLLENGAKTNIRDNDGKTPLFYTKDSELLYRLLMSGADPNIRDNDGKTPLFYTKDEELVHKLLMSGADPNIRDNDGKTPLFYTKDEELVYKLLMSGADPNIRDNDGNLPL